MNFKTSRDSLSVEVSQEGNNDAAHTNHSQLVPSANQATEEDGNGGSTEHIPVNLFPAILITQVTLLQGGRTKDHSLFHNFTTH